jgi:magnesium-transporting ATPase (P-type)
MQEHYRLANGVSKDEANLVFHNAARKVIKDTFKHTRCIYVASYYMQVNLLPFCTQVLKLLIFYFDIQM